MTPSKAKSHKRTRKARPSPTERLARNFAEGPLLPAGQVKMSDVLE